MVEPGSGTAAGPANATEEVKINAARRVNTNFIAWEPYCWWDLMKSSAEEYQSSQSQPQEGNGGTGFRNRENIPRQNFEGAKTAIARRANASFIIKPSNEIFDGETPTRL